MVVKIFDYFCGVSAGYAVGWQRLGNETHGSDDSVVSNRDSFQDRGVRTNPNVISKSHRFGFTFRNMTKNWIRIMKIGIYNRNSVADQAARAYDKGINDDK